MIAGGPIASVPIAGGGLVLVASGPVVLPLRVVVCPTGRAALPLRLEVVDARVFEGSGVRWWASVMLAGVDVSDRVSGQIEIHAVEAGARVASLSLTPASAADLASWDKAAVTIDVTIFSGSYQGTWRRFTGVVEQVGEFDPATRLVPLDARDGYQERIAACTTAAQVQALLGGAAAVCESVVAWDEDKPDAAGYFDGLLATCMGSPFIAGDGLWRFSHWEIGAPVATFTAGEYFDGSLKVRSPSKAETPSAISASLSAEIFELNCVELNLTWEGVDFQRLLNDGVAWPATTQVKEALNGLSGWYVKGNPTIRTPLVYDAHNTSGQPVAVVLNEEQRSQTCIGFDATLYHRWYRQVTVKYSVDIALGGTSDRDDSVSVSIRSEWDAGAWESAPTTSAGSGIYQGNAPTTEAVTTGYEGLPSPHPLPNGAMYYYPDLAGDVLQTASAHVVARAARLAAAGARKRGVVFEREIDPRWEIGDYLGAHGDGVLAAGQLVQFDDVLDHDSGAATTSMVLACPAGAAGAPVVTVTVPALVANVAHAVQAPALGNWIGASDETPPNPDEDSLCGMLANVVVGSVHHDPAAPIYIPQFRIVMPEIAAALRDPTEIDVALDATVSISGGVLVLEDFT